jgi:hypothetical protein
MYPFTSLPGNLAAFCDVLRRVHRFRIGPGELHDAARALEVVDLSDANAVRNGLRPVLSATRDDATVFDPAFVAFFFPERAGEEIAGTRPERRKSAEDEQGEDDGSALERQTPPDDPDSKDAFEDPSLTPGVTAVPLETGGSDQETAVHPAMSSYSPLASASPDAPVLAPVEAEWSEAARALVRHVHVGLSRRWRTARRGNRFDLRRTLRAGLQTGGETLRPRWMRRPRRAPRFVLLIDGSRSMSLYTQTALRMAVAMANATSRIEVFTFSTAIRRVTDDMRRAAAGETRRIEALQYAWGGGTSIGECLREFIQISGERLLGRETIVVVASDGLDVGSPEMLRDAVSELRRRSAGVVWLNPLIDTPGYQATAGGMTAVLPFVTAFASVPDAPALARLSRLVRVRS